MSRMSKKEEQRRFLIFVASMAAVIGGLWAAFHLLAGPGTSIARADIPFEEHPFGAEDAPAGTIELCGREYSWYGDVETYLFMGRDENNMADFLLLAVFNRTGRKYGMVQINRDTMASVPLMDGDGNANSSADMQVCCAHWYGGAGARGCENTVAAVSGLMGGLPIDGYYELPMDAVPSLNRAVGGVTVEVRDDFSKVDKSLAPGGTVRLTDSQAYTYVHDRYGVGDGENASRMERHLAFMEGFAEAFREKVRERPGAVNDLYAAMKGSAVTDMSAGKICALYSEASEWECVGVLSPDGELETGRALGDGKEYMEFHADGESLGDILGGLLDLKAGRG